MYVKDSLEQLKYTGVTELRTTLDYKIQKEAVLVISNSSQSLHTFNVRNISCVILNAKTGEVLSMIGSMDYFGCHRNTWSSKWGCCIKTGQEVH